MSVDHKNLYVGLIRLHILHHAVHEPVFGLGLIQELARHGYGLSAGTLYPVLHGLEAAEAQNLLVQSDIQDQLARIDVWRARLAEAVAQGSLVPFLNHP